MATSTQPEANQPIPYHQIRALHDSETITVYQAYSEPIALAAVTHQKLNASPDFKMGRMTWIKPSWCWMMYRSGYSFKDSRQSHILALKMRHADFERLLREAVVCHGQTLSAEERGRNVRVQWDPERGPRLEVRGWRSIQIGISGETARWWVSEGIVGIEDVTERARDLKSVLDGARERGENVGVEELVERGLVPREREFVVSEEIRKIVRIDV
jgi:hypothetical protein